MKRQIMKSIYAFCTGVMTLVAASSLVVSCYNDAALWDEMENVNDELKDLDSRLTEVEKLKEALAALTSRVDALYTLEFQVSDSNELQYSFDGGKTWVGTGVVLAEECTCEVPDPCTCKEVSLVDNGDSVTITVGEDSFTIEKPKEIVFDIRAGKVYFASESTQKIAIKTSGVADLTVMAAPKGWYAEIASDGMLEVTAPNFADTQSEMDYETWTEIPAKCAASGYVKIHACGVDGKCMVGKLPVEVTERPVSVKAYGGKAYFNAAGRRAPTFYYGASTRDSFEADVAGLLEDLNGQGWTEDYMTNFDEDEYMALPSVEAPIADLLGEEPKAGVEYVVWALVEDYNVQTYTMDDFLVAYYSLIEVTAVEDEAQRTAYNVTATVEVKGVDSYYALALPANYLDYEGALDEYKENFIASFSPDSWSGPMGKLYTESYTGSVLDIAEGTTSSMSGNYAPNLDIYLLIIPMDGRSWDEYTVEDIFEFKFTTAPLTAGGSVNATATPVEKFMTEVFNFETYEYEMVEKIVDKYSELAVEVKPSADNWVAFYFQWLDEEDWALYGTSDELLVEYLLEEYGMTASDVEFPYVDCLDTDPKTTMHFVAMFVDENGKYGELAKVSATTEELVYSDIVFTDPYETNLVDGVLKNTTDFKFKPVVEGGTASSYKYYWLQTQHYNPYEGMDDAALAQTIHFDRDNRGVVVKAEDLVDGCIVVPNNKFGSQYMVAVLPYDEAGAPGKSAAIFNFESVFSIDVVITEGAEFDATKPEYTIALPTVMDEFGDGAIYYYEYQDYYKKYLFRYSFNVAIEPKEGTTVSAAFVDTKDYPLGEGAAARASQLWQGSFGSWYTYTVTETFESSYRDFYSYEDADAPDVWFVISWTDAEGNYYYVEQSLQAELQKLADKMNLFINSPYGKQYSFDWTEYGAMMGLESMPACIDLGVSMADYFMAGIDYEALYGEEAAGMWMAGLEAAFEIEMTDKTSGIIHLLQPDYVTGELARTGQIEYSDYSETSCTFNSPDLYLTNVTGTLMTENVTVMSQGVAM